jgi:hypothetical protein
VIPLLGIYPKESKSGYNRDMLIAAPFTTSKLWNQPRYPKTDEYIKKIWYIYIMSVIQP